MKKLIICADGTWNKVEEFDGGQRVSTNVCKLAAALDSHDANGNRQVVCYMQGVGTHRGEWLRGGAFGFGISRYIREGYQFLVENYEPGDQIWLFGFSRGAYTARSIAGLIRNCGILRHEHADKVKKAMSLYHDRSNKSNQADPTHPDSPASRAFRNQYSWETGIKFIGVWDTVGALGVPGIHRRLARFFHMDWQFHDTTLSSTTEYAYHALSIHEHRTEFLPTLWNQSKNAPPTQKLEQVWFSGAHSDIGGGYAECTYSNIAFEWMIEKAKLSNGDGLKFQEAFLKDWRWFPAKANAKIHDSFKLIYKILDAIQGKPGGTYRKFGAYGEGTFEAIHPKAVEMGGFPPGFLPEAEKLKLDECLPLAPAGKEVA
ncbi:MAG: DUF2235 domain-containing protein [Chthoniobacteraceae bacterium]